MSPAVRRFAIEEEFFFVDPVSGDLVADGIERTYPDESQMPEMVMREVWKSQIEVATRTECYTLDQLRVDALSQRSIVIEAAARNGLALIAAGCHPFSTAKGQVLKPERHQSRVERLAFLGIDWDSQVIASGLHVHVGVEEDESLDFNERKFRATQIINRLLRDIYVLAAMGANSPFINDVQTGFATSRMVHYTSIVPQHAESYEEHLAQITIPGPSVSGWEDIPRGDIQVSERLPTIEFRVPDSVDNIEDALLLACLARAMVDTAVFDMELNKPFNPAKPSALRRAKNVASRHGVDRVLLDVETNRLVSADDYLLKVFLPRHERALRSAGDWEYAVEGVRRLLRSGTGARRQRAFYALAAQRFGEAFAGPALVEEIVRWTAKGVKPNIAPDAVVALRGARKKHSPSTV